MIQRKLNLTIILTLIFNMIFMVSCKYRAYKNDGKKITFHSYDPEFLIPYSEEVSADPNTFESLSEFYGRDKNHVYYWGEILDGIDAASFRIIDDDHTADKNHVYFNTFIIEDADPESFRIISKELAEDKNDFFWSNEALKVADKATFVLIPDCEDQSQYYWAKDKYKAYNLSWHVSVPISDYDSFKPLSGRYAVDDYQVYHRGDIVNGADPKSFKEVALDIGQDKNGVYYKSSKTDIVDFRDLKYNYDGAYYQGNGVIYTKNLKPIHNADFKSFRNVGKNAVKNNYWYADDTHVWYGNKMVKEADPKTFFLIRNSDIIDGECIDSDPEGDYAADGKYVFYHDSILAGADPATFEIISFNSIIGNNPIVFDKSRIFSGKPNQAYRDYIKKYH